MESDPYSLSLLTRWEEDDEIKVYVEEGDHFIELPASKVYDVSEDGKTCFFSYALPAGFDIPKEGYRIICLSSKAYKDDIALPVNKDKWVISMPLRRKDYRPSLLFDGIIKPTTTSINFEFLKAFEVLHVKNQSLSSCDFTLCGFQTDNRWFRENYAYVFRPGEQRATTSETGPADRDLFESETVSIAPLSEAIIISEYVPYDGVKISNATMVCRIDGNYVYSSNTISSDVELQTQHAYHMYVEWDGTELKFNMPHDYVDLGLSVKWATTNVGAKKMYEEGDYFMWGEVESRNSFYDEDAGEMGEYKWSTLRQNMGNVDYPYIATKYCVKDYSGYVDGKTVLEASDDAATEKWGRLWRTPTSSEWKELLENCTWERAVFNEIDGYKVTSNIPGYTDRYIFLPDTHWTYGLQGIKESDDGMVGLYWSSDLSMAADGFFEASAKSIFFDSENIIEDNLFRMMPATVRPVTNVASASCAPASIAIRELSEFDFIGTALDLSDVHMGIGESKILSAFVLPANAADKSVTWTSSDPSVVRIDKVEKMDGGSLCTISAISGGRVTITATTKDGKVSDKGTILVDYVDLGLSVKWGSMNLGADVSTGSGNYYAWGERSGYNESDTSNKTNRTYSGSNKKTFFNWVTYKYCDGTSASITKYNPDSSVSTYDGKVILDAVDDAASYSLKGDWRIPTSIEVGELIDNCTFTLTNQSGVSGYKVTGPNGNSMFLPFAGRRIDGGLCDTGNGYYQTSVVNTISPDSAWQLCLSTDQQPNQSSITRAYGAVIRPVLGETLRTASISLSSESFTIMEDTSRMLFATILPSNSLGNKVTWSTSRPDVAAVDEYGNVTGVGDGKAMISATLANGSSASCEVTVIGRFIDLGLSVKWASCNLGASSISEVGKYYAWGETKAKGETDYTNLNNFNNTGSYVKSSFGYSTYKYNNGTDLFLTKYNCNPEIGDCDFNLDDYDHGPSFQDNKWVDIPIPELILDASDDAATQNLNGSRMPTYYEWNELIDNCEIHSGKVNGQQGYFFFSKKTGFTDKYIFLPCAHIGSSMLAYWSSSLRWTMPFLAFSYVISAEQRGWVTYERCEGLSIRPVKD